MLKEKTLLELREYIENHILVESSNMMEDAFPFEEKHFKYSRAAPLNELEKFIKSNRKPTFSEVLFSFIDRSGYSDSDVYKKAGIDRRHFSKIRSNPGYKLGKSTAIALALALELNKKETEKLLSSAGFSLSENDTFDLIIQFCLEKEIYDMDEVNQALDYFSLKPLGQ